ncbi:MAG: hypothetical protein KFF73_06425 [Cyclobacteriaceae bacterium]|nr:hypothetical protein [Cyclobacteriaceae bacterium]
MKIQAFTFLFVYIIVLHIPAAGQSIDAGDQLALEKFNVSNPLELNLVFDIKTFIKNKQVDEYIPARISYRLADGSEVEKSCRIRPRGNYRRNKCYLPPIKIDFDDSAYLIPEFENMGEIKMVSLCNQAGNFEQYLIKEYLIYQAYELISEYSLKTYFLKVNFIDSGEKKKPFSSYSFLIEDIDDLADRKNADEIDNTGLLPVHMQREVMNQLGVFQFMVGNTDWHMPNLHNIKLLKVDDPGEPFPIPVPYDFDYSGIVNTNYAVPHESLPIESITERYYMGNCMSETEFAVVRQNFMKHKEEIISLFGDCPLLQTFNQKTAASYINDFYAILENDKLVKQWLFSKCD